MQLHVSAPTNPLRKCMENVYVDMGPLQRNGHTGRKPFQWPNALFTIQQGSFVPCNCFSAKAPLVLGGLLDSFRSEFTTNL